MYKIIKHLFDCKGVVNVSSKDEYEVQSGVFASVYINFKSTLSDCYTRQKISRVISQNVDSSTDFVCGIESGGSYYAAAVADLLNKKLVFFRKSKKQYNIKNRFAGMLPQKGERVTLIDDVMSSGNTLAKAVNYLKNMECNVDIVVIFSYCWERQIASNLGIKVIALSNSNELVKYGLNHKLITKSNAQLIADYVKREESRLYRKD